jgi:hypothetical protein
MEMQHKAMTLMGACAIATLAAAAGADPVEGIYRDGPLCDNHGTLFATEEFGDPTVFSPTQHIRHAATFTQEVACPMTNDPTMPNALVSITNLTNRFLTDLFYVGDVTAGALGNTSFSNVDGIAGQTPPPMPLAGPAFRIDSVGANRPLIFESLAFDGIFAPGETWQFIVQDYRNDLGLAPDAFFSVGFAGGSPAGPSSASIVQFVPTPGAAALLALGGLCTLRRRR